MRFLHDRCGADRHHGLARSHFGVQHGRRRIPVDQQFHQRLHRLGLGLERLAPQRLKDVLALAPQVGACVLRCHIDRRVLRSHLFEQALAKFADEVAKTDGLAGDVRQHVGVVTLGAGAVGVVHLFFNVGRFFDAGSRGRNGIHRVLQ